MAASPMKPQLSCRTNWERFGTLFQSKSDAHDQPDVFGEQ